MDYDLSHLKDYKELCSGPIQSDEALFLYSLVKVLRPKVIVEFGFYLGHSAINFLRAMPENCKLYSFDHWVKSKQVASQIKDDRFKFIFKNQQDFFSEDIDNNLIDIIFIDASHKCEINIKMFNKIKNSLNENALILIHDTGSWNIDYLGEQIKNIPSPGHYFLNKKEYLHQPDERWFVNYLRRHYPKFNQIHLHSLNTLRHGLTILQRNDFLQLGKITYISYLEKYYNILSLQKKWIPLCILIKSLICIKERRFPKIFKKRRN